MKIAILLNSSWNIVNFRASLIRELIANGHEVIALAPGIENKTAIEAFGVEYISIKRLTRKGTNPFKDISLIFELRKILRAKKVELLLSFTIKPNIYGTIAGHMQNVKSICTVTGLGYSFISGSKINYLVKGLYKFAFSRANIVVFQNPDDRDLFLKLSLVKEEKTRIIYGSGVDVNHFKPWEKSEHKSVKNLLFVGRLLYDKGIKELLQAFAKVIKLKTDLQLHIVGNVDDENPASVDASFLKSYREHPNIHFYGFRDNVYDFVQDSDVVILPSYREGLPRVLLEALSMEKPIITTDVPGCREVIVHEKNGFLVSPKSTEELEKAILRISETPTKELRDMGKIGRVMCLDRFSNEIVNSNYLKLIEKLSS